jgi:hypothetical protein
MVAALCAHPAIVPIGDWFPSGRARLISFMFMCHCLTLTSIKNGCVMWLTAVSGDGHEAFSKLVADQEIKRVTRLKCARDPLFSIA